MFKEFKDVKAREEIKQEESTLEKLINLGNGIVNELKFKNNLNSNDFIEEKIKTIEIQYNEKDIVSLIRSSNLDDNYSKQVFGVYTGFLLTKLTEARHAEGKKTNIIVDGVNQEYILYGTKKADSIVITNCEGHEIGSLIGYRGSVERVIINNCEGNFIGSHIGFIGNVEQVIIHNCQGRRMCDKIGYYGDVGQLIINNCKDNDIGYNGNVKQKIINNPEEIEKQGLTELIQLVDSMTGKNYQEMQEIARKIGEYSNV